jgi:glucose-1-phosphate adenylyltransferase
MARVTALILAGGEGTRLSVLTAKRAKPAVPFAGRYRMIDFILSNLVNSSIYSVGVLTQYRPRSLGDHIRQGRPWDLDREIEGGITLLQPYLGRRDSDWYAGTADAVAQNIDFVNHLNPENVLILAGDHIYKMDYRILLHFHEDHQADVTIPVLRVPMDEASRMGILAVDNDYRIVDFEEKPAQPKSNLASMGIYVFRTDVLNQVLEEDKKNNESKHDFGRNIIPKMIQSHRVYAFPFGGYWVDVGTVQAYWEAHMDLLQDAPPLELHDRNWIIYTRSQQRPPVDIRAGARVANCLLTDGSIIAGTVEDSIFSPGVRVMAGAVVRQSIVMEDTVIEPGAVVERAVIDKNCIIGQGARVGAIQDTPLEPGITLVGKNTRLPAGLIVEPGVGVPPDLTERDFPYKTLRRSKPVGMTPEVS